MTPPPVTSATPRGSTDPAPTHAAAQPPATRATPPDGSPPGPRWWAAVAARDPSTSRPWRGSRERETPRKRDPARAARAPCSAPHGPLASAS